MLVFHVKYLAPSDEAVEALEQELNAAEAMEIDMSFEEHSMTVVGCCFEHTVEKVSLYLFGKYGDEFSLVGMHVLDAVTDLEEGDEEETGEMSEEEWQKLNTQMDEEKKKHNKEKKDGGSGNGGRNFPNGSEYIL